MKQNTVTKYNNIFKGSYNLLKNSLAIIILIVSSYAGSSQEITDDGRCAPKKEHTAGMTRISDDIGDFTIVDSDGVAHNLYSALDAGNTVLIDLFFTS